MGVGSCSPKLLRGPADKQAARVELENLLLQAHSEHAAARLHPGVVLLHLHVTEKKKNTQNNQGFVFSLS